jgi:hypothetical protein
VICVYDAGRRPKPAEWDVEHRSDLVFPNSPDTCAVRVFQRAPKPRKYGLHFTTIAAVRFADHLEAAAGRHHDGGVDVFNRSMGNRVRYTTLSPDEARQLARRVRAVAEGWI